MITLYAGSTETVMPAVSVDFSVASTRMAKLVALSGVLDSDADGDVRYRVHVRCSSADSRFNGAEATATLTNHDVPLLSVVDMHPAHMPYIAGQVTVRGTNFDMPNLDVSVGGVLVSGPPIYRTVLVNTTSERLVPIRLRGANATRWLKEADASRPDLIANTTFARRRAKAGAKGGGGGGSSGGGGARSVGGGLSAVVNGVRYDHSWYEAMVEALANRTAAAGEQLVVFTASETYDNSSAASMPLELERSDTELLDGFISPGPRLERVVLASATLRNTSYLIVREFVQPFNFSLDTTTSTMTFLTPPWAPGMTDEDGYATLTISSASGPHVELELAIFYSDDCPQLGWFGRGLDCRPCMAGGWCPGGDRSLKDTAYQI